MDKDFGSNKDVNAHGEALHLILSFSRIFAAFEFEMNYES